MACLEITCAKCEFTWFTNSNIEACPKCQNKENNHVWFDEENDYDRPDDDEGFDDE